MAEGKPFVVEEEDNAEAQVQTDLAVSALLFVATYLAVLHPPGGLRHTICIVYLLLNASIYFVSVFRLVILLSNNPLYLQVWMALGASTGAYFIAMVAAAPAGYAVFVFCGAVVLLVAVGLFNAWKYLDW